MATNDNNGYNQMNSNNGTIYYTNKQMPQEGVGGFAEGRRQQRDFANDFFREQSGYLDRYSAELENQIKMLEEQAKIKDKMGKSERNAYDKAIKSLTEELNMSKQIKELKETSDVEAMEFIIKSNKAKISGQEAYMKMVAKTLDLTKQADRDIYESMATKLEMMKAETKEVEIRMKNLSKTLDITRDNLARSIAKTTEKAQATISQFSNMLNLKKIADESFNSQAREYAKLKTSISQQFGFTSNGQYNGFVSNLNSTLVQMNKDMSNLYNSSDLKQYLENINAYGITTKDLAESTFKDSVMATKYLGTSTETMTSMYKFMKLTNNNDEISKHNKTIVSLLRSDLGISSAQLDALSQIAYASNDDKLALGMSSSAVSSQSQAMEIATASLTSLFGNETTAGALGKAYNDFITNPR